MRAWNVDGEDERLELVVQGELLCPFCSLAVVVGYEPATERKCLLHSRPACEGFALLEPLQFLEACTRGEGN